MAAELRVYTVATIIHYEVKAYTAAEARQFVYDRYIGQDRDDECVFWNIEMV